MASLVLQPVTAPAQTPNSQLGIAPGPVANTYDVTFFGIAGRVYIIQISSDLVSWVNAPFVELGSAADITWRFSHTGNSRCFLRLVFTNGTNYPAGADGDVDGDGVSNLNEITSGTDPFNPDTDGDGQRDNLEGVQTSATRYRVNLKRRDANGDPLGLPPLNDPSQPDSANPPPGTLRYYGINVTWPATLLLNPNAPPTQSQRDADYLLRVVAGANAHTTDPATGTTSATGPAQPFNSISSIPVGGTTATAKAYKRTTTYVYSQIFPFPNNSTQGASVTVTEALNTPIPQNDGDVLTWLDQQLTTNVGIPATPPVALCNTLGPNSAQREILRFTWSFPTAEPQRSIFWSETFTPEGGGTPITKIKSGPAPGLQSPEYTIDPNVENGGACGSYVWNRISTELDVNGDGDVSDSVDGLVNYLPGYEGPTAKLHTGIRFTTASYSAPQAMRLILTGLGSASVDNAEFKITAVTSYDGYCGNGSDPAAFAPGKAEDFSFHPTTDQRILAGTISANQIQAPIYAKDYGAWATVELTLSRGGIPLGPPLTFTLPGDSNGDRLADRWQDPEIKEWNRQYGTTRPLTEAERDQMKPPVNGAYPDDEPADSDGPNNGDGGRNLPTMPTVGDGLTVLEEYRGYLLDYGKASPAGPLLPGTHQRLSTARKEALFQCHIMPEIQDAAQNNANAAAQQFSLANTFNAAVGFYADLQKGPALDLYAVEIPITDAGPLITYVDGSMRPAYIWNGALFPNSQSSQPATGVSYIYDDSKFEIDRPLIHPLIYTNYNTAQAARGMPNIYPRIRRTDLKKFSMCGLFTRFSRIRVNGGIIQSERKSDKAETNYQFNGTPPQTGIQLSINGISEEASPSYLSADFNLRMEYVLAHEIGHTFTQIQNAAPWNGGHYGSGLTLLSDTYPVPATLGVITTHDDEIIKIDPRNRLSIVP